MAPPALFFSIGFCFAGNFCLETAQHPLSLKIMVRALPSSLRRDGPTSRARVPSPWRSGTRSRPRSLLARGRGTRT